MSKILIVDDDTLSSKMYATKLQTENHEVTICPDGGCALEKIKEIFDLILLDIMMPELSGPELLKHIKDGVNKNSPVLIYTNLISDKIKQECLQNGAKEYLIKSDYTPTQLVEKIKSNLSAN